MLILMPGLMPPWWYSTLCAKHYFDAQIDAPTYNIQRCALKSDFDARIDAPHLLCPCSILNAVCWNFYFDARIDGPHFFMLFKVLLMAMHKLTVAPIYWCLPSNPEWNLFVKVGMNYKKSKIDASSHNLCVLPVPDVIYRGPFVCLELIISSPTSTWMPRARDHLTIIRWTLELITT